jgi:serine/threonine-protein kinase
MPSEQMAGRPLFSSDLYALGLTAIYLLTGKIPQELETDPLTGELKWQQYAPNLSPDFSQVLNRTIQNHPRDRFPTAQEMLTVLAQGSMSSIQTQISSNPNGQIIPSTSAPLINSGQSTVVIPYIQPTDPNSTPQASKNWQLPLVITIICLTLIGGFGYYQYDQQQKFQAQMAQLEQERKEKEEQQRKEKEQAEARAEAEAKARVEAEARAQAEAKARAEAEARAKAQANQNQTDYYIPYRDTCGDPAASGSTWYAVVGNANLSDAKNYCGDAFRRKDGYVQIASFSSYDRAENFANQLNNATGYNFWVK